MLSIPLEIMPGCYGTYRKSVLGMKNRFLKIFESGVIVHVQVMKNISALTITKILYLFWKKITKGVWKSNA